MLDSHYLVVDVQKDDLFGVVLDRQFILGVVHHVIDRIRLFSFDLITAKVYLETPQSEAPPFFLGFLEEHIYDGVNRSRDG